MAALGSPARTLRGLLRELRYISAATGRPYRDTAAYRYLMKAFRANRVRKPEFGCSGVPSPGLGGGGWRRRSRAPGLAAGMSEADSPTPSRLWSTASPRARGRAVSPGGGTVSKDFIGCLLRVARATSGK